MTARRAPTIRATIERRLLVNYRVDPDVLVAFLPPPFRPVVVDGYGVAGICLIRLGGIRPAGLRPAHGLGFGLTSENAAHRVAVQWDTPDGPVTGVYIPRRDTSSRLTAILGGRAFPGWHHRAHFDVQEGGSVWRVEMRSRDGTVEVVVAARRAERVMDGSVFGSVEDASAFFRCAPVGYAATPRAGVFDGVELTAERWAIEPLHLQGVRSSVFDDPARFPRGTAVVDSAFLMADVDSTWKSQPSLVSSVARTGRQATRTRQ
ncbi:MAG TPA: hypothetical protein VM942_08940 [Acidimicrobiales bacterium]|nr:hypothetical protein [Acidimicrobiales bacterium]